LRIKREAVLRMEDLIERYASHSEG
jgi:hypothetical protein